MDSQLTPMVRPSLVFVVSDDPAFVSGIGERFGALASDVEVHAVRSLSALESHLSHVTPDLMIVDWTTVNYRSFRSVADEAPIVVLDRTIDVGRKLQALKDGAFEYLPFEEGYLESVVLAFRRARRIPALESELRETEARYAAILDAASDGIFVVQGSKLTYVNDRFAAALGYDVPELLANGGPLESLAPPEEQDKIRAHLARVALSSGGREIFDVTLTDISGEPRFFELSCRSALMNGRRATVGAARDVTAIRQLTREVEEYRRRAGHGERLRALGEIAAGVTHDFNNVLEVILGRIDLIRVRKERGEDIDPHLGVIATAAEDAAAILRRVKEFTPRCGSISSPR
ncbi:MAG: PAS domain S-box protein, partial [Myxococcota bacterium]